MKLYNIYNEVILEAVTNFKTWVSGPANIARNIKDMLQVNAGGKYYYVNITYPNDENIGGDSDRWIIITQYGLSKDDNLIIRALEVNNNGGSETGKAKTYMINKIKKMSISKVPIYSVPKEFEALYGDITNDTSAENPFKAIYTTAKFGTYQYAASTLKNKERQAAKAAELEKQQTTQQPAVEPAKTTTKQTVEPQVPQQQNKSVVKPQVTQQQKQQEPEVEEPEMEINPEEEENNNELNK